jgi:hypothetical protein
MWIPHRVFFAELAFAIGITCGAFLLAWRPIGWRSWTESVVVPSAAVGSFIGLTATRGMPLLWWERLGEALWVTLLMGSWLLGSAAAIGIVRHHNGSRVVQVVAGGVVAAVMLLVTRMLLS